MQQLKKYNVLFFVMSLYSCSMYGMLVTKKMNVIKTITRGITLEINSKNYGLTAAKMPQKANGILGNFRLDKKYGVRDYLGQYIACNEQQSLEKARWEGFNAIQYAYQQFLNHNSSKAIQDALNNNVIDTDYAMHALYFTHKVITEFQEHIEYNQEFANHYSNDAEQWIWVDEKAFNVDRFDILKNIKSEKKTIVELVDFLRQQSAHKPTTRQQPDGVFKKEEFFRDWSCTLKLPVVNHPITPYRIAYVHDGALGKFDRDRRYTIQEYLKKYLDKQDDTVEWRAIKKAYDSFLFYNMPSRIQKSFDCSKNAKNITQEEIEAALAFTRDVACAMRCYLELDFYVPIDCPFYFHGDCEGEGFCNCFADLYDVSIVLRDEDVQLFAQLGIEPVNVAQTWDGALGDFALIKKQNGKALCAIQDYLCKYIARNLQIPETAVSTEATFLDIKKAFESFVQHNHPDAILKDFHNGTFNKEYAKNALQFTGWVIDAFEKYLSDFKDDSYEMELFELFWHINIMKEKSTSMRFIEKGEWSSAVRE